MNYSKIPKIFYYLYFWTHYLKFRHSQPFEGDAANMDFKEVMYWCFKFFVKYIEQAERGKGIESFFENQDLSFASTDGFVEKASFTIGAGGDILPTEHLSLDNSSQLWDDVKAFYYDADLVMANLESPITDAAPISYASKGLAEAPFLNNGQDIFERLVDGGKGINFFTTANNHTLDQGEAGLIATLDFLDAMGYPHVGSARSSEERDRPVIIERNGIKIAFLSWTFSLNRCAIPVGKGYLVNHLRLNHPDIDISPIQRQVKDAKAAGADAVVACLHWSLEYESYPTEHLIKTGHRLMENGIDAIIGNHAHTVQPMECYRYKDRETGEDKQGLIIYALGDLISANHPGFNSRIGNLARIRFSKGEANGKPSVRITVLDLMPFYIHQQMKGNVCNDFRILRLNKLAEDLHSGMKTLSIPEIEAREVERLEKLARKLLGPAQTRKIQSTRT
jgi:poly-gamma-glutamate capsule biosynthesis protein CapA/YwtB (metallophosphatase superfamily)